MSEKKTKKEVADNNQEPEKKEGSVNLAKALKTIIQKGNPDSLKKKGQ